MKSVLQVTLAVCVLLAIYSASGIAEVLTPVALNVGATRSSFRNVNAQDAEAAFRVFVQTAGSTNKYDVESSTRLFATTELCEAAINRRDVTLAILDAYEYVGMDIPVMVPEFVHLEQGVVLKDYLLLTLSESGIDSLEGLKDKEIVVLASKSGDLSLAWLNVLLGKQGQGSAQEFFGKVEMASKASKTVLPVFFGSKSACLVDRLSFETMAELNPQVGKKLRILAVSEPFLDSVTCLTSEGFRSENERADLMEILRDLHLSPNGRQILNLFGVDQLAPFKDEYLDGVKKLWADAKLLEASDGGSQEGGIELPVTQEQANLNLD